MNDTIPKGVESAIRSRIYKLLSLGFRYPTSEMFDVFRSGEFITALSESMAQLPYLGDIPGKMAEIGRRLRNDLEGVSFIEFQVGFAQTFDVGAPEPPCPPYEGAHRGVIERTVVLVEITEFYKTFGLKMATDEEKRDLPDHICAQLEFLHFLTFKETQTREEEKDREYLRGYVLAQKDFLERHLLTWVPIFSQKVRDVTRYSFFSELAGVTASFLKKDCRWVTSQLEVLP